MSDQWSTTNNFKEEIIAEAYGVLPRMQLINQVSSVSKVAMVRSINRDDHPQNGNSFSQYYAKECREESAARENESKKNSSHVDGDKAVDMDGTLETYNNFARPAYFCMTIATTDLKG